MNSKILLVSSLAAAAVALLPPCLPGLGAEFCPSSAPAASHDSFKSLHEAVRYPNLTQQNELEEIFSRLNKSRMEDDLVRLTRLPNRSANSSQGKLAQELIRDAAENSRWVDLSDGDRDSPYYPPGVSKSYTPQYNIHLETLGGQNDFDDDFTSANQIIVGAHMDSISSGSSSDPEAMIAPGADDNGSGVVVLLEVLRVVAATFFKKPPRNPIAFHWYAGEELGLLGSKRVFEHMQEKSEIVKGMLNLDMVGYSGGHTPGSPKIAVQSDEFIDQPLTAFVKKLIKQYSKAEAGDTKCEYACSDHASAHKAGYPSAMIGESAYMSGALLRPNSNPYIHSEHDTIGHIDFDYMLEFAKIAAAFVVELAYTDFEEL